MDMFGRPTRAWLGEQVELEELAVRLRTRLQKDDPIPDHGVFDDGAGICHGAPLAEEA
jgi:hypothetical protein